MSGANDGGTVIDRLFAALAAGDLEAAGDCFTPGGVVWHSFDRVEQDRAAMVEGWRGLVAGFPERSFVDAWRAPIPGGFVQRQLMVGVTASGARLAWPVCIFVTLEGDKIARLDEYIDRTGKFELPDHAPPR
jgi:ketosteroid isomerase-like protein